MSTVDWTRDLPTIGADRVALRIDGMIDEWIDICCPLSVKAGKYEVNIVKAFEALVPRLRKLSKYSNQGTVQAFDLGLRVLAILLVWTNGSMDLAHSDPLRISRWSSTRVTEIAS